MGAGGTVMQQAARGAIDSFATMAVQGAATGEVEHAMGINPGTLKERMTNYAVSAIPWAIFGGATGAHYALRQHAQLEEGFKQWGLDDVAARDAATKTMTATMAKGMDTAESMVGTKAQDEGRLKPLDRNGIPLDSFYQPVKS